MKQRHEVYMRVGVPTRVSLGPFTSLSVEPCTSADIAELDRDPKEGHVWFVQRSPQPQPEGVTIVMSLDGAKRRLVVQAEGGPGGAYR